MRCAITIALAALALTGCVNLAPERAQPQVTAQLPEGSRQPLISESEQQPTSCVSFLGVRST